MIEGKLANRADVSLRMDSGLKAICGKCSRLFKAPKDITIEGEGSHFICKSYVGTSHFVYEVRSGWAICYCSQKCAKKHNHRFK